MNVAKYLQKKSVTRDKLLFVAWEEYAITTEMCIRKFRKNNEISEEIKIEPFVFIEGLATIGYHRKQAD